MNPSRKPPLEKTIVARIREVAESLGFVVIKMHGGPFMPTGIPDLLLIKHGRCCWIEVKRPGEEPTRIQQHRMRELARAGCSVAVARSANDARQFLGALL